MILYVSQMVFPWAENQVSHMPRYGIQIGADGLFAQTHHIFNVLVWNLLESNVNGESLIYITSWMTKREWRISTKPQTNP